MATFQATSLRPDQLNRGQLAYFYCDNNPPNVQEVLEFNQDDQEDAEEMRQNFFCDDATDDDDVPDLMH
jgi:predicted RNA-binding protein with PUA-like domain